MAAMTSPSKEPVPSTNTARRSPISTRNPLPLSASQESQVKDLYYKRVRQRCAEEVREFATCCSNRTFTATFMCRKEQKAMNKCMIRHATQEEQDAARAEWFATIEQRRDERETKEEKRKKDEKFWKDWWDKDMSKKPGQSAENETGKK